MAMLALRHQWPLTGKFHGDTDRRVLAASSLIVDSPSSIWRKLATSR